MDTAIKNIQLQVQTANEEKKQLVIKGGDSKSFLGREISGTTLDVTNHRGVISYEPTELYITVKAGTPLHELNDVLAERKQMLAFEPPVINENTTIGGVIATGISGPRRPFSGAVRDYVLGVHCLNGLGEELTFGGQVMKNVAGYDLSRLMTGAFGTLGVILDVSLKVMPVNNYDVTLYQQLEVKQALTKMHELSAKALPISASSYQDNHLYIRLSGDKEAVLHAQGILAMNVYQKGKSFWQKLRDMQISLFQTHKNLWRLSVPANSSLEPGSDNYLIDWGGAQYWLESDRNEMEIFNLAESVGGSATLVKGTTKENVFHPLTSELEAIHLRLKQAFDPQRILNSGKMYATI